jgi:hypothetical protein
MEPEIYNELLSIEASCNLLLERCKKLRLKAETTNAKRTRKKPGLSEAQRTKLLADREKQYLRMKAKA